MARIPLSDPGGAISQNVPREPDISRSGAGLVAEGVAGLSNQISQTGFNLAMMMKKADDLEWSTNSEIQDTVKIKDLQNNHQIALSQLKTAYENGAVDYQQLKDASEKANQNLTTDIEKTVYDREAQANNNTQRLMYKEKINEVMASEITKFRAYQRQYMIDIWSNTNQRYVNNVANSLMNYTSSEAIDEAVKDGLTNVYKNIESAEGILVNDANRDVFKTIYATQLIDSAVDQMLRNGDPLGAKLRLTGNAPDKGSLTAEKDPFLGDQEMAEISKEELESSGLKDEYVTVSIEEIKESAPNIYQAAVKSGQKTVQVKRKTKAESTEGLQIGISSWSEFLKNEKKNELLSKIDAALKSKRVGDLGNLSSNMTDLRKRLFTRPEPLQSEDYARIESTKNALMAAARDKAITPQEAVRKTMQLDMGVYVNKKLNTLPTKSVPYLKRVASDVVATRDNLRKSVLEQFPKDVDLASSSFDEISRDFEKGIISESAKNVMSAIAKDPAGYAASMDPYMSKKAQEIQATIIADSVAVNPKETQEFFQRVKSIQAAQGYNQLSPVRILPAAMAKNFASQIANARTGEQRDRILSRLKDSAGPDFPQVAAEIKSVDKNFSESYAMILSNPDQIARVKMFENISKGTEILKAYKDSTGTTENDLEAKIQANTVFKQFSQAKRNQQKSSDINAIMNQIKVEAAGSASGETVQSSVDKAVETVIGTAGTMVKDGNGSFIYVPRVLGNRQINPVAVDEFLSKYRSEPLAKYNIDPIGQIQEMQKLPIPDGPDKEKLIEQRKRDADLITEDIKSNTIWVMTDDNTGIQLMYHDKNSMSADPTPITSGGKPIRIPFIKIPGADVSGAE